MIFSPKFRAYLSVVLLAGVYLLASCLVAGLLYLPLARFAFGAAVSLPSALSGLGLGLLLLWFLLPSRERFAPPGLRVFGWSQPRLVAAIGDAARMVWQKPPDEIYLAFDANAAVSQRGGVLGHGGRRVLVLGLPLLRELTLSQFRAAMLHEFGHFCGADLRFGAWVYRTRTAISHTLLSLPGRGVPHWFFMLVSRLFLKFSQSVARHQEFAADRLAARFGGALALTSMLESVQRSTLALEPFWSGEVNTVIHAGYLPPLTEGFHRFLGASPIVSQVDQSMEEEKSPRQAVAGDSHPPLMERIEAVRFLPQGALPAGEPSAITLLDELPKLEAGILAVSNLGKKVEELKSVEWDQVGEVVYLPLWREFVLKHKTALKGLKAADIPDVAWDPIALAMRSESLRQEEAGIGLQDAKAFGVNLLGAALVLALAREGWQLDNAPGEPIGLTRGDLRFLPFGEVRALMDKELDAQAWEGMCGRLGISDIRLLAPQEANQ